MARRPGAHQTATASPVKSCQPWCVIVIPSRRGRQSRVSYATILDSNRAVTELLCADKKHYINKVLADCWLAISALAHTYTRRSVLPLASVVTSGVSSGVDNPKWDLSPGAMQCWWVLLMRKQLSMAATAGWYGCAHTSSAIWPVPYVRVLQYWNGYWIATHRQPLTTGISYLTRFSTYTDWTRNDPPWINNGVNVNIFCVILLLRLR